MNKKISFKVLGITALLFAGMSLTIGVVIAYLNQKNIVKSAQESVDEYVKNVNANLEIVDGLLIKQVNSSMSTLKSLGKKTGAPNINGLSSINGQTIPNLRLGESSQVGSFKLVDEILSLTEATATLFVRRGNSFIRVSTNVKKEDGSRAIGTELDPNGRAVKNILEGKTFYGAADILGKPYLAAF
jgi:methyl-accepting chemotaxis protein